jgi:hypothetical protein
VTEFRYQGMRCISSDQRYVVSLKLAGYYRTQVLEVSREGKGEASCAVLYRCTAQVTSQEGRVSEERHRQFLLRCNRATTYLQHLVHQYVHNGFIAESLVPLAIYLYFLSLKHKLFWRKVTNQTTRPSVLLPYQCTMKIEFLTSKLLVDHSDRTSWTAWAPEFESHSRHGCLFTFFCVVS